MNLLKEILGDLCIIAFGGIVLWHLSLIVYYGEFVITEGNRGLLFAEIVGVALVILLGIERLIDSIRRH